MRNQKPNHTPLPADAETLSLLEEGARTRCEVWTRVMGYHRPVSAFNPGKQSEHCERTYFLENRVA